MSHEPRPAIGVCASIRHADFGVWSEPATVLPAGYVDAVQRAGGLALVIAPDAHLAQDPDDLLERLDGLILSGGEDLDPASYGAEPHPLTVDHKRLRDDFEIALVRRAMEIDLPVLGICRGMQVMNVALGGTLHQHLPDQVGHEDHRRVLGSFDGSDHDVDLTPDSLAAQAAGELRHVTKSHHHQGVDRLGEGLEVTGVSCLDALPEAIELPGRRYALGVQWHPEADESSRVVGSLVAAAAAYRESRALSGAG